MECLAIVIMVLFMLFVNIAFYKMLDNQRDRDLMYFFRWKRDIEQEIHKIKSCRQQQD